jgi:hypothetical protein
MKKNLFGLFALVAAIAFTAFTIDNTTNQRVWVNKGTFYELLASPNDYNAEFCTPTEDICAIIELDEQPALGSTIPAESIEDLINEGKVEQLGDGFGLYEPDEQ